MAKKNLYFVAVIPDDPVKSAVMELKHELAGRFHSKSALKSPPHITLHMPFQWREEKEGELVEKFREFRFDEFPFEIELKDFGFFSPNVVFVDVRQNEKLALLQKELVSFMRKQMNLFNANYKDKPFHPHVTIGFRDLKKSLFPEIKNFYQAEEYKVSFKVSSFCLLKHNGKSWDEFGYYP